MKSLLEKPESARAGWHALAGDLPGEERAPRPLAPARWDWREVRSVLVVRLRSIGDTVLATSSLDALRRFLPQAKIDVLLESWVAPVLEGFDAVDNIITVERGSTASRARAVKRLRAARYDVAYNLHGGTTATLLTRASGARHRVGYSSYQYSRLFNHPAPPPTEIWGQAKTHSVEQQLALLGWTGVPVSDRPRTRLAVTEQAASSVGERLRASGIDSAKPLALIHPAAAFDTKQWATPNFARVAENLSARGFECVAISAPNERRVTTDLIESSAARVTAFTDLSLPEVTALAARSRLFVGNDSGVAHISAAVRTPSVVIFGSSNVAHWRPWTVAPAEVVREELSCQPCPGYSCSEFDAPECIRRVKVEAVVAAIDRVLDE
ncbi:MAG TPA: glycosyltransferase family 9 protein, partial [Pyrinomonadaceae bacterium]|nr:glycosyltransferase family 9 protein [Pyrinomonadaceae bacterium]